MSCTCMDARASDSDVFGENENNQGPEKYKTNDDNMTMYLTQYMPQ